MYRVTLNISSIYRCLLQYSSAVQMGHSTHLHQLMQGIGASPHTSRAHATGVVTIIQVVATVTLSAYPALEVIGSALKS